MCVVFLRPAKFAICATMDPLLTMVSNVHIHMRVLVCVECAIHQRTARKTRLRYGAPPPPAPIPSSYARKPTP